METKAETRQQQRIELSQESVVSKTIDRKFGRPEDYIEVHIFNQNDQILTSISDFQDYSQPNPNELNFDPVSLLNDNGYTTGKYKLGFNVFRKKIFNTALKTFTLKAISSTRTELRIVANNISNTD